MLAGRQQKQCGRTRNDLCQAARRWVKGRSVDLVQARVVESRGQGFRPVYVLLPPSLSVVVLFYELCFAQPFVAVPL